MSDRPDFPTMEAVESANVEQLARWYRFLPVGDTKTQRDIMYSITERLKKKRGLDQEGSLVAALSEKVGHGGV